MGLCLGAACMTKLWSGRLGKVRAGDQAPKTSLGLFV
jgi:hypothetical protein